jgi:hypothetical protein
VNYELVPRQPDRIHAARKRLGSGVIEQLVSDYEAGSSTYGLGKGTVLGILDEQGVNMRGQGPRMTGPAKSSSCIEAASP